MEPSEPTVVAWILEPAVPLLEMQELLRRGPCPDTDSISYDFDRGGYLLESVDKNYPIYMLLALLKHSGAIEFEYELYGYSGPKVESDEGMTWYAKIPAIADAIVSVSAPLRLKWNNISLGEYRPGWRFRIPMASFWLVEAHGLVSGANPKIRLRLEPRDGQPLESSFVDANSLERNWDTNGPVLTSETSWQQRAVILPGWPALSLTSCERGAVWLPEPKLTAGNLLSLLEKTDDPLRLPSVEHDLLEGGFWVRGLAPSARTPREIRAASRVYEQCARAKLDPRGISRIPPVRGFLVAVSEEITLWTGFGAEADCLGRFLPGRRYRVPLLAPAETRLHVRGTPGSKVLLRLRYGGKMEKCTFANADGELFDWAHGLYKRLDD